MAKLNYLRLELACTRQLLAIFLIINTEVDFSSCQSCAVQTCVLMTQVCWRSGMDRHHDNPWHQCLFLTQSIVSYRDSKQTHCSGVTPHRQGNSESRVIIKKPKLNLVAI